MERRDENLEHDAPREEREASDENYTDREQRLADEDRLSRDLERERDDLERSLDISVTPNADDNVARTTDARDQPTVGDQIGEAAGGISGVVAGAAIGSIGGPIGSLIGGIAGAVGGWWAGRAISEAASRITDADEEHYRAHYDSLGARRDTTAYDEARPAYHLGHIAGYNPTYAGREFEEIEPELERGWTSVSDVGQRTWTGVREYARTGYSRSRSAARDAAWLGQDEAVRTGDSFENATPDLASTAASRPALEGEEISPAMLDYMADNTEGSSGAGSLGNQSSASGEPSHANRVLDSSGPSGSLASSGSQSVPADAETPRGTQRGSSMEAVSGSDTSYNDPAGPNNADRSLSTRGDDSAVYSMDDDRETRSIGDADERTSR